MWFNTLVWFSKKWWFYTHTKTVSDITLSDLITVCIESHFDNWTKAILLTHITHTTFATKFPHRQRTIHCLFNFVLSFCLFQFDLEPVCRWQCVLRRTGSPVRPSLPQCDNGGRQGGTAASSRNRQNLESLFSHEFWGLSVPCAVFFGCFAGLNRLEWYWRQRRGGEGRRRSMWWRMVLGGVEKALGDWGGIVWAVGKREREPTCLGIKSRWADVESDKPQEWVCCCCL